MSGEKLFQAAVVAYHCGMRNQTGSALWLILMAIALLAALAIAITRSANTAEQNGSVEHNRVVASQVMRYAAGLAAAIDRMRMNGVSENQIDFDTPGLVGYANAACTTDDCKLFGAGGAQGYSVPPGVNNGANWIFTSAFAVPGAGDDGQNELVAILPGLTAALCQQIDTEVGPFPRRLSPAPSRPPRPSPAPIPQSA